MSSKSLRNYKVKEEKLTSKNSSNSEEDKIKKELAL